MTKVLSVIIIMKRCSACSQYKEFIFFSKNVTQKDGFRNTCKACDREQRKKSQERIRNYNNLYERKKYQNDPLFRLARKLRRGMQRVSEATRKLKIQSSFDYLGCSIEDFKLYIEKQFKDGMSWENYGEWHLDHIIPLDFFIKNESDPYQANHFSNFQPLWREENLRKGKSLTATTTVRDYAQGVTMLPP